MNFGAQGLTVRFGRRLALSDVDLELPPGEVRVVVGGDGAGKTTLLEVLAGARTASAGEVRRPSAERIGYLPATSGVYPDLSVAENLAFRAAAYRMPRAVFAERRAALVGAGGLLGHEGRLGGELSGGMRQKLGVICAMLAQPDLLVLDEPTTGVDPASRRDLWRLIAHAAADGAAVVVATTYLDEAERAVELVLLEAGRVLAHGAPEAVRGAMPGLLLDGGAAPPAAELERAWRRGARWRLWRPGAAKVELEGWREVAPDLEDAVTVALLARETAEGVAQ